MNILFIAYGGGHIRTLLPVVRQLLDAQSEVSPYRPIILALTTARVEVKAAGLKALGFSDLINPELDEDALAWGKRLSSFLPPSMLVSEEETRAYLGLSFRDLVTDHGEEEAWALWQAQGRAAFCPRHLAVRTLHDLAINVVVTTNSPRAEKAFLEAAYDAGIPSLVIWPTLATHEIDWIGGKPYATRICVDGDYARRQMLQAGRGEDSIVITGNPQYDDLLYGTRADAVARFRHSRGWDDEDRVLLFAQQIEPERHPFTGEPGDPQLPEILNRQLIEALDQEPANLRLCIRYHPNQTPLPLPKHPRVCESRQTDDLALLLHAVDGLFTCSSTLGYQAALVGVPVFQGMFSVFSADVDLAALVGAKRINSSQEFESMFRSLVQQTRRVGRVALPEEETSATRVVRVIDELVKGDDLPVTGWNE